MHPPTWENGEGNYAAILVTILNRRTTVRIDPHEVSRTRTKLRLVFPVTIVSRVFLVVADLIVLGVTWHSTYRTIKLSRIAGQRSAQTFSVTLLRDGRLCRCRSVSIPRDSERLTKLSGQRRRPSVLHRTVRLGISRPLRLVASDSECSYEIRSFPDGRSITSVLVWHFILDLQGVRQLSNLLASSSEESSVDFGFEARVVSSPGLSLTPGLRL